MKATDAKNYIRYLKNEKFAGFDDWRLPTLEEAISIRESEGNDKNGLFINEIFDSTQKYIWTSDTYPPVEGENTWVVNYLTDGFAKDQAHNERFVRAVRSGIL